MAKTIDPEAKKQRKELLALMLKKGNTTHAELVFMAEQDYMAANVDMLTAAEKKRFNKLVFK